MPGARDSRQVGGDLTPPEKTAIVAGKSDRHRGAAAGRGRTQNEWGDVRTHRLRVASVFLLVTVFVALPSVLGPIPPGPRSPVLPPQRCPPGSTSPSSARPNSPRSSSLGRSSASTRPNGTAPTGRRPECSRAPPGIRWYTPLSTCNRNTCSKARPSGARPSPSACPAPSLESGTTDAFIATMTTTEDDSGPATRLAVGDTVVVFGEVGVSDTAAASTSPKVPTGSPWTIAPFGQGARPPTGGKSAIGG